MWKFTNPQISNTDFVEQSMKQLIVHIKRQESENVWNQKKLTKLNGNYLYTKFVNLQSPIPRIFHKMLEKKQCSLVKNKIT